MSKVYLITEGQFDKEILERLLPEEAIHNTEFVVGTGSYSAQSLARSILAARRAPVALVLDADTTESSAIRERRDFLEAIMKEVAVGIPFKVFLAVPELEILLVEPSDFLKRLTNKTYSTTELELAKLQPKKFLQLILGEQDGKRMMNRILKKIDAQTISAMRKQPLLQNLSQFLSTTLQPQVDV